LLERAALPPIRDRVAFFAAAAAGKRVLDVGMVGHMAESAEVRATWLHDHLRTAAAYCLGVDILDVDVEQLRRKGYNAQVFDVTARQSLGQRFDLITAGEVIEHLGEPEQLFAFARQHLTPGGQLMLSTPNPYYLTRVIQFLRARDHESVDHTAIYFPSAVAELAERAGLRLEEYRGVQVPIRSWRGQLILTIARWFSLSPDILSDTMIYSCTLPS
jgi:2-polyprenyl-3-methyl-5-hydroxy-6-metoxy-1,4-benzoquinol methylase